MTQGAFTTKFIEAVRPTVRRQELSDPALPGFYLIVQPAPSGKKSWTVRYRHQGRVVKYTIGEYPRYGLAEAREAARAVLREASEGKHPHAAKQVAKADGADLFVTAVDDFIRRHVEVKNKASTAKLNKATIEREFKPRWKGRALKDITRTDIVAVINRMVDRGDPQAAVRALRVISKFFAWAVGVGRLQDNPCLGVPVPAKVTKRKRTLTDREIKLVWQAAATMGYPFNPMIMLLLLTGQRREEVAAARWSEFDLAAKQPIWSVPGDRTKNEEDQVVTLSPTMLAIITSLPRFEGSHFLFTTTGHTSVSGYSKAKERIDREIGKLVEVQLPHWTLHDLRRTLHTRGGDIGILPHIREAVMNHGKRGSEAHYNHAEYRRDKAAAWRKWDAHVSKVVVK